MDYDERMIRTKAGWAARRRGAFGAREVEDEDPADTRLPPGQHVVRNWPVLDLGYKPEIDLTEWRLAVAGAVAEPVEWTWEEFQAQPRATVEADFHCVTSWSTYDNQWEGLLFTRLIEMVRPLPTARFVLFTAYDDYTTNLPLNACDDNDVLIATRWNGKPLTKEHGAPARLIVPKRYAWKGAKWIKTITFSEHDQKGFWEVRGYSNTALPWENDRYG